MIFTPYTQPVKPAEWVGTVDLNTYAKGLANKQQMFEQSAQSVTTDFSKVFGIKTQGPDQRRLNELQEQLKQELSSLNLSDLTDMGTVSQVKSLIRKYSNDPQMLEIHKRKTIWDSEQEKKAKAEEKGQKYTSPALETLGPYFSQNNFYEKPEGVILSKGWLTPKMQDTYKQSREGVKKKVLNTKTGVVEEVVDPNEAKALFLQLAKDIPNFEEELQWNFQQSTKGTDWQTEGQIYVENKIEEERLKLQNALFSGDNDQAIISAKELQRLQTLADSSIVGEELKNKAYDSWLQTEFDKIGYSMDVTSFVDYKRDPLQMEYVRTANDAMLKNLESANNIKEALVKQYIEAGYDPTTGEEIKIGGKSLADVKAKQQKKENETEPDKQRRFARETMERTGKVTQDVINLIANKDEKAELYKTADGQVLVKVTRINSDGEPAIKGYEIDRATGKKIGVEDIMYVFIQDYIQSRMGKENTPEFVYRYNKPTGSTSTPPAPSDLIKELEDAANNPDSE